MNTDPNLLFHKIYKISHHNLLYMKLYVQLTHDLTK